MALGAVPDLPDPQALLGRVAVHLGRQGAAGLPGALELLVAGMRLRSAVLRDVAGAVVAVAGDVVHALPVRRLGTPSTVDLPVRGYDGHDLAVLRVRDAAPATLPVLRAATSVLSLVLTPRPAGGQTSAGLTDTEAELAALAGDLHDGPVQDLVAARYAIDIAVRGGDATLARISVQAALVALRGTLWHLRTRGADDLPTALQALATQLAERGAVSLQLRLDPSAELLGPPAVAAYRLVQAVVTNRAGVPQPAECGPVVVLLDRHSAGGRAAVVLTIEGGAALVDPGRWRRTAAALDGDLCIGPGRLRLVLPVAAPLAQPIAVPTSVPPRPAPRGPVPRGSVPIVKVDL